ncbi:alpha/beta hydrolase [Acaryochloris sp. CCMEE 5410]|uniref:alpha/beta hydrolase n=1 Tax=Acaryochloris sp. CCMEE 5410 TaxID=310037 RepID=UPI0002484C34|nr:alpha/beta hydrolase [Acaryochloris sp. CCMEE 5410]KAI9133836.1 alpha/beta hydrolase [Acaryochloris sp. CCMEE 5410]
MLKRVAELGLAVGSAVWLSVHVHPKPARGAERIFGSFLSFEQSVSVESLETFAETGRITGDFIPYARYISPEQRPFLQNALQQKLAISPVAVSQFLYSDIGELMVRRIAKVIRPKSNQGGFYALRGALIVAAADPEGLTVLNFLKHYPIQGLKIDLDEGLAIFSQIRGLIRQTNTLIETLEKQTPDRPTDNPTRAALTQPGQFSWQQTTLTLSDQSPTRQNLTGQSRQFPVDLYLPQTASPQPKPIVVISHGLNSNRDSYGYLAEHLASYGFVVVMPEHIGSNTNQLQALMLGRVKEVTQPTEFLDRPLDVQFVLDELERLSTSDPMLQGQLNLDQVGVIGQSFGGYTALALAGATINFEQLQQDCGSRLKDTINISLILQCQVIKLPQRRYELADPRIKGSIAINPVTSSVLGETLSQIQTPVMFVSGSADKVSPSLLEQATPFTWLTVTDKYFVLMQGGTHFSTIDADQPHDSPSEFQGLAGPSPGTAKAYLSALSVAFMKRHILEDAKFDTYLSPQFVATLRQGKLKLNLSKTLSTNEILNPG